MNLFLKNFTTALFLLGSWGLDAQENADFNANLVFLERSSGEPFILMFRKADLKSKKDFIAWKHLMYVGVYEREKHENPSAALYAHAVYKETTFEKFQKLKGDKIPFFVTMLTDKGMKTVGDCVLGKISKSRVHPWETVALGEIHNLHLLPKYRSLGIGQAFLNFCFQQLKNRGLVPWTIWVMQANVDGQRFYKKMGGTLVDNDRIFWMGNKGHLQGVCYYVPEVTEF